MKLSHYIRHVVFIVATVGGASCISMIGGIGLQAVEDKLLPLVPLIIALPALNTMVGDYAAIIAAHAVDPAERKKTKRQLARAISKSIWVNIVGLIVLSVAIAWKRGYVFTSIFAIKFVLFVALSMILVILAMFATTSLLDKLLERKKLNPDDILIPIVTSVTDVLMLGLVALAAVILL